MPRVPGLRSSSIANLASMLKKLMASNHVQFGLLLLQQAAPQLQDSLCTEHLATRHASCLLSMDDLIIDRTIAACPTPSSPTKPVSAPFGGSASLETVERPMCDSLPQFTANFTAACAD